MNSKQTVPQYRYPIDFPPDHFKKGDETCQPRGPIGPLPSLEEAVPIVKNYFSSQWKSVTRNNPSFSPYPYLVPGPAYPFVWDWDSYFICSSVPDEAMEYVQGTLTALLKGIREDGRASKWAYITEEYKKDFKCMINGYAYDGGACPILSQFSYVVAKRLNTFSWLEPYWASLKKAILWFEQNNMVNGYFVSTSLQGLDNNPDVYGRPFGTVASIDLACWMYREYCTIGKIAGEFGDAIANEYAEKAEALKTKIQNTYWDHIDHFFYSIDTTTHKPATSLQNITWVYFLKFRNVASLFPLWAGVASKEQASLLREKILSEREFLSVAGIRSHSAIDPLYNNLVMENPSNWQGPVWGISTFLIAYGLAKYGYKEDAMEVAGRLVRTFAADIQTNQCVHEYYHGDTGQPLIKPGFMSWNILAYQIIDDLEKGTDCTSPGI